MKIRRPDKMQLGQTLKSRWLRLVYLAAAVLMLALALSPVAAAQEAQRSVILSSTFTNVTVEKDQAITLPVQIRNMGKTDELVDITIESAPSGWDAQLASAEYGKPMGVRGMYLTPYEPSPDIAPPTIYFKTQAPSTAQPGDYQFVLKLASQDKIVQSSLTITIGVVGTVTTSGGATMTTTYPTLSGPSGSALKFSVNLANDGSEATSFDLSADLPSSWNVGFSPAYESTRVSTIRLDAGSSRGIDITITPPQTVTPGEYPFTVTATWNEGQVSADMKAVITGTYQLLIGTPTGVLNAEATAGHETHVSILAYNYGSADLGVTNLSSSKPDGWTVTFNPNRLDSIKAGEIREIDVAIKPAGNAIAGDYTVGIQAYGDRASANMDLRVTVGRSSSWGWIGLGIVVAVIAGMVGVFWRVGRR